MPLSIKDPEADRLARDLAARTGETITEAVIGALRSRLAQVERRTESRALLVQDILEIGRHCASLPALDDRSDDEILGYDEHGIPTR